MNGVVTCQTSPIQYTEAAMSLAQPPGPKGGNKSVHNYSTRREDRNTMKCHPKLTDENPQTHLNFLEKKKQA